MFDRSLILSWLINALCMVHCFVSHLNPSLRRTCHKMQWDKCTWFWLHLLNLSFPLSFSVDANSLDNIHLLVLGLEGLFFSLMTFCYMWFISASVANQRFKLWVQPKNMKGPVREKFQLFSMDVIVIHPQTDQESWDARKDHDAGPVWLLTVWCRATYVTPDTWKRTNRTLSFYDNNPCSHHVYLCGGTYLWWSLRQEQDKLEFGKGSAECDVRFRIQSIVPTSHAWGWLSSTQIVRSFEWSHRWYQMKLV